MPDEPIYATVWMLAVLAIAAPLVALAPSGQRSNVVAWMAVGATAFAIKHLMITALPQWSDAPLDAAGYAAHAEALYLHWSGVPVDPATYRLAGYAQGWDIMLGRFWMPHADIPYTSVLGTAEWLYSALVALHLPLGPGWPAWATGTNVLLAAMLPAGSWLIARHLGVGTVGAAAAAALMALDPTTSVNASWLLKDVLTAAVAMLALLAALQLIEQASVKAMTVLALSLAVLMATRFVGFLAIALTLLAIWGVSINRREAPQWPPLAAVGLSFLLATCFATFPQSPEPVHVLDVFLSRFDAVNDTMMANEGATAFDPSVHDWRQRFKHDPMYAALQVIARTLCAPYPWSVLEKPLAWKSYAELYLLGSLVWLLCLPFIVLGLVQAARRRTYGDLLCLGVLLALALAYIAVMGEWSTRQRAFMNPLFFALFGLGLGRARAWISVFDRPSQSKGARQLAN